MLKATNVDGVYSADPKKDPKAKRYDRLSHQEAIQRDLKVMDATAFALARENRMPIIVFSIREPGAIEAVLRGKGRATDRRLTRACGRLASASASGDRDCGRTPWQPQRTISTNSSAACRARMHVLKQELGGLRTGRASASLLDPVQVDAYGTHMPLNQVATVSVPEPRLIAVQVWDRSMVHAVEKAIIDCQSRARRRRPKGR